MWYWYLVMFLFGTSFGGLMTLIGMLLMNDKDESDE